MGTGTCCSVTHLTFTELPGAGVMFYVTVIGIGTKIHNYRLIIFFITENIINKVLEFYHKCSAFSHKNINA
jgi:hypothetical protein